MTAVAPTQTEQIFDQFVSMVEQCLSSKLFSPLPNPDLGLTKNFLTSAGFLVQEVTLGPVHHEGSSDTGWARDFKEGPLLNQRTNIRVQLTDNDVQVGTLWLVHVWERIINASREKALIPEQPETGDLKADIQARFNREITLTTEGHIAALTALKEEIENVSPLRPIILSGQGDQLHDVPFTKEKIGKVRTRDTDSLNTKLGTHAICGGILKLKQTTP